MVSACNQCDITRDDFFSKFKDATTLNRLRMFINVDSHCKHLKAIETQILKSYQFAINKESSGLIRKFGELNTIHALAKCVEGSSIGNKPYQHKLTQELELILIHLLNTYQFDILTAASLDFSNQNLESLIIDLKEQLTKANKKIQLLIELTNLQNNEQEKKQLQDQIRKLEHTLQIEDQLRKKVEIDNVNLRKQNLFFDETIKKFYHEICSNQK